MDNHFFLRNFAENSLSRGLSDKSLNALSVTKSKNTIDAYESDWNDFCDWCTYHKKSSYPCSPETVVNYINDLADFAKAATIRRRISAISENYNASGEKDHNPCRAWIVKEALIGLTRLKGSMQKGKTPVYWEEIEEIISRMDLSSPVQVRDKAILLLGFMGAFRRSELSSLDMEDLKRYPQGIVITIRHSKTDQSSEGQQIGIPYIRNTSMDCIGAINEWIRISGITNGPLFRSFLKNGKVSSRRLSDKSINLIVKKYVASIGLNPDFYGAHSLRHGFATYAALKGVEERLIMKQTRHHSVEMVRRYINEADLFTNNPIDKIFGSSN
ncbi:site-specific integrase [uncultured Dialister sp.]|uniref:site-specific integrase n=1 Tax=uncultured Dialister sp. TaxID=278064 RepID=UPI0025F1D75C|nr:site-specific integrase [uncultured Dialister sp.]